MQLYFFVVICILILLIAAPVDGKRKKKKSATSKSSDKSSKDRVEEIRYSSKQELDAKLKELNRKKKLDEDDEELTEEQIAERQAKLEIEEKELRKDLFRTRRNFGADSREMATALHKLGKNVYHQGKFDEANELAKEVVRIHEQIDGPESMGTAMALSNLGSVSYRTKQTKMCELAMYRATAILINKYGKESPEVLLHRGKMLTFQLPFGDKHEGISYEEYKEEVSELEEEMNAKLGSHSRDESEF